MLPSSVWRNPYARRLRGTRKWLQGPYTATAVTVSTEEIVSPCATKVEISVNSCFGVTGSANVWCGARCCPAAVEVDLRAGAPPGPQRRAETPAAHAPVTVAL